MNIRDYNFSKTQVSAIQQDDTGYFWIAFEKNSSDVCILQKTSVNEISQLFYEIEFSVDEIVALHALGIDIYVVVDSASVFAYRISIASPVTVQTEIDIPVGVNEAPVAIVDDGTYVYILTPGSAVGENAKICKYNGTTFVETIDLTTVNDAVGLSVDGTDIWIVTSEYPSNLVRVYELSGGIYTYAVTNLS